MTEVLIDPETSHSDDITKTAFNRAFNTRDDFWTWISKPGHEYRNTRFIMAMHSTSQLERQEAVLEGEKYV